MNDLATASFAFPTFLLTILLIIALLYWVFVILGALDLDLFHVDGDIGGADGGGDGIGHGGGDAMSGIDGVDAGGDGAGGEGTGGGSFLSALGLRRVPLTISLSAIILVSWIMTVLGSHYLGGVMGAHIPQWAIASGAMFLALIFSLPIAGLLVRPLGPVFETVEAKTRYHYIGSYCTINTGKVNEKFGQATIDEGAEVLVIHVRCDQENKLGRNERAMIIDYDDDRDAYVVEPYKDLLE